MKEIKTYVGTVQGDRLNREPPFFGEFVLKSDHDDAMAIAENALISSEAENVKLHESNEHLRKAYAGACAQLNQQAEITQKYKTDLKDHREYLRKSVNLVADLKSALQAHHKWHLEFTNVPQEFVGMNMALEYSDSTMCEQTVSVLIKAGP